MSIIRRLKNLIGARHPVRMAWHHLKALIAALRYGFPARKLTVIAITGTDGKTTTVAMTAHILHESGIAVGAVSTSFFRIKDKTEENPTHKTSISPFAFQKFLRRCVNAGCTHAVTEISSHGLVQHRNDFLWPAVAAITNISPEHLDYHGTMEQYKKDKAILFRMLKKDGVSVLNADDETYEEYRSIPAGWRIAWSSSHAFASAMNDHDCGFWASDIQETAGGISASLQCNAEEDTWNLQLKIPGLFNLENALCAISCAHAAEVSVDQAVNALGTFPGVPGRLERIDEDQLFAVYVDFTVTPNAYEKTLSAIRATLAPGGRLLVLTGSCGDRMPEKRPVIGKIVSELADVVVVSEDETITEDQHKVIDEVWAGIDQNAVEAHKIFDRREGIRFLLKNAQAGDAVALCGMGACTTMQTREGLRKWDEREVARSLLRQTKETT
ncbi:MAG: UDP-N-acetylmuramyl-tripeptide synthetase [Candidatus Peribacteraceae bacterium]|nr:UDP-N-acetylmuramyl-tripeptide synthetase [Candidatus Peribacteraceae bacterium]